MLLIVNYHYLGDEAEYSNPGIHPISPERFEKQIVLLEKECTFLSETDLLKAIKGEKKMPKLGCLITFDDGLRCQFDLARPILKRLGVPAVFFASSLPLSEHRPLFIHKLHWSRAHRDPRLFGSNLKKYYAEAAGKAFRDEDFPFTIEQWKRHYPYDDNFEMARVKFLLGRNSMPRPIQTAIIDSLFKELVPDEAAFTEMFYMNATMLKTLAAEGHGIGLHGHAHLSLPELDLKNAAAEVTTSFENLNNILPGSIHGISYPYGDVVETVISQAKKLGLSYGVTLEQSLNENLKEPFLLARADVNDVPGGKDPKFTLEGGLKILKPGFELKRSRYYKE